MNRTTKTQAIIPDDYLKLVRMFPLRKLRNDQELADAVKIVSHYDGRPDGRLSDGERDYLEALSYFIKEYDERVYPFQRQKSSPVEILRTLMDDHGMNIEEMGKVLGSRTAASLVLSGKRELSKSHIRKLAARFKLDPGLFL